MDLVKLWQENLTVLHANNKGEDQSAHLISIFVICFTESLNILNNSSLRSGLVLKKAFTCLKKPAVAA